MLQGQYLQEYNKNSSRIISHHPPGGNLQDVEQ